MRRNAADWAAKWDANSLIILRRALLGFDSRPEFSKIKAKVLYMLCRTDALFPPKIAPGVMQALAEAGVEARYFELDSDLGHSSSGPSTRSGRRCCASSWRRSIARLGLRRACPSSFILNTLGHASIALYRDGEAPLLLTDPWLIGSVYWRSWWLQNYPDEAELDWLAGSGLRLRDPRASRPFPHAVDPPAGQAAALSVPGTAGNRLRQPICASEAFAPR